MVAEGFVCVCVCVCVVSYVLFSSTDLKCYTFSSGVFNVELRGPGRIALHSVKEHKKYMRIKDGKLDHGGDGGKWCDLYVHDVGK